MVVFEPHTFSWRNQSALTWYYTVFDGVSRVLLMPPPTHGVHDQIGAEGILARVREAGINAMSVQTADSAIDDLKQNLTGNEVILLLSSGPLDGLPARLPPILDQCFG